MNTKVIMLTICIVVSSFAALTSHITVADDAGNEYYVDSSYKGYSKGTAEQPFKSI